MTLPQLNYPTVPIAIIGSACRFPGGASSPSKLWQLIEEPCDLRREIPPDRFNVERFYHESGLRRGTSNIKDAYTLSEDPRVFDADFFGIKPVEVSGMDPNHRLLLEVTYEALESAGIPKEDLRGSHMGVFVGLMGDDYYGIGGRDIQNTPRYFASGAARSLLSNRLSYFFDLHGPSMTIDTACSSSLVALHQAVQSLRTGESTSAIVAGSNLILGPEPFIAESQLKMLSPTGRSQMWDKGADGYARGDGIGVLILKKLSDAIANNDSVECLIRETGVNQDGRTQGITTPSQTAQADLIRETYRRAGLDLSQVSNMPHYFEAHGTGTPTGDPIEAGAIHSVFFPDSTCNPSENCRVHHTMYVGSLKTVMGHSEGAAGVAGIMKASLALQNAVIPPNLLLSEVNPQIAPFYRHLKVPRDAISWPVRNPDLPRRVSVNSFGFGGTNAHAILENFLSDHTDTLQKVPPKFSSMVPFVFSAMSETSLFGMLSDYTSYLRERPSISLRDLSWTINNRRSDLPVRIAVSASNTTNLASKLEEICKRSRAPRISRLIEDNKPCNRILGIFTGQGAQWATMGAGLLRESRVVDDCFGRMQKSLDTLPNDYKPTWLLSEELRKTSDDSRIGQVRFSQPLCTAVQIALVDLLKFAKVKFAAVVGHSSGEIAAAYAAGYLSAEDAIRIAYLRGYFCDTIKASTTGPAGSMIAIGTTPEDALDLISLPAFERRVCMAAINSPTSVTISGDLDALTRISLVMDDEKKFSRLLRVDRAYHSHHMVPSMTPYVKALQECGLRIQPRLPADEYPKWISSVGQYWAVEQAMQVCGSFGMVIEVGPHPALKSPTMDVTEAVLGTPIAYAGTLSRGRSDTESFSDALGSVWTNLGKRCAPPKLLKGLPARQTAALRNSKGRVHQLIGSVCPDQSDRETRFRNYLSLNELSWIKGHKIMGKVLFPAAGYVAAVVEAIIHRMPTNNIEMLELSDLSFKHALMLDDDSSVETQVSITVLTRTENELQAVFSYNSDSRNGDTMLQENASGKIKITFGRAFVKGGQWLQVDTDSFYESIDGLSNLERKMNEAVGYIAYPKPAGGSDPPAIQGILLASSFPNDGVLRQLHLPFKIDRIRINVLACQSLAGFADRNLKFHAFANLKRSELYSVIQLQGLHAIPLEKSPLKTVESKFFEYKWAPETLFSSGASAFYIQEQIAFFHLQRIHAHFQRRLLDFIDNSVAMEWTHDMRETIDKSIHPSYQTAIELIDATGESLFSELQERSDNTEMMTLPDISSDSYSEGLGLTASLQLAAEIVRQLNHRFAGLSVLEIGNEFGCVAKYISSEAGRVTGTYTYTEIHAEQLEKAKERLGNNSKAINFETFDPNEPMEVPTSITGAYDLIITPMLSGFTRETDPIIRKLRSMVKAGGYLVVLVATSFRLNLIRGHISFGGHNPNTPESFTSMLSGDNWAKILRHSGFTTIDITQPEDSKQLGALSILVAQAIDDRVEFLRDPLAPGRSPLASPSLCIIGGNGLRLFINDIQKHFSAIQHFQNLSDIETARLSPFGTVVSLVDLEEISVFQEMTAAKLRALQKLFSQCKNVLWVSSGAKTENVFKNIFVGLQRTVMLEMPHLRIQHLEFSSFNEVDYGVVAKKLLQLEAWGTWDDAGKLNDILWILEPELLVRNGVVQVPRLLPDLARNERHASKQQALTLPIAAPDHNISISWRGSQSLVQAERRISGPKPGSICLIYSLLRPVHFRDGGTAFISIGKEMESDNHMLVVSEALSSIVRVPPKWTALAFLYGWSSLVVLDSEPAVAESLAEQAVKENIDLVLLTTESTVCSHPWRFLHPRARQRDIAKAIPIDTGTYVQMRIDDELSTSRITHSDVMHGGVGCCDTSPQFRKIAEQLEIFLFDCSTAKKVGLNELASSKTTPPNQQMLISWERDSTHIRFLPNGTYWLVGLTGGLGLSLCYWMIARGARYIALTSRNPNIDPALIRSLSQGRCMVELFPGDVASRDSLFAVYQSILSSMPAIKGVVQGAMVLHDAVFPQIDLEGLEAVMRPKVQGSIHLDEIFKEDSLDFFIFLSSVAYAAGHAGQSAYAMANGFMAALAANRRHRGLSASVLNLDAIRGNGYVSREMPEAFQHALKSAGFCFLSEQAFHEVFAEGILSSKLGSPGSWEISTGLNLEEIGSAVKTWRTNPIFSHLISRAHGSTSPKNRQSSASSAATQLKNAENEQQIMEIVTNAVLSKLRITLQLNDSHQLLDASSDAIGIDSIIAVDMRSWFRQELKVEISILDIVNSRTIRDMLELVSRLVLADHISQCTGTLDRMTTPKTRTDVERKVFQQNKPPNFPSTEYQLSGGTAPPTLSASDTADTNTSTTETSDISDNQRTKRTPERTLPLSFAQSRFWFLNSLVGNEANFNVTTLITLKGHLDAYRLSSALNAVGQRHEALRTIFFLDEKGKGPVQGILPLSLLHLEWETTSADEKAVEVAIQDMQNTSFSFSHGPLLRMKLISQSKDTHYIVLGYHHILTDGIGFEIFCSDLDSAYRGELNTNDEKLLQYSDFTLRQLEGYKRGTWEKQISYWTTQFATLPRSLPLLSVAHRSTRPESLTFDSHKTSFRMTKLLEKSIMHCCQSQGVNRFHFYLATFAVLLLRFTKGIAKDVCIGVADGNRKQSDTLKCLGLFLNLLPLRMQTLADQPFVDTLKAARHTSDDAFSNSEVPFDVILQHLSAPRSPTASPLFQAFINYRPNVRENRNFLECAASGQSLGVGQNPYDISLDILESQGKENLVTFVGNRDLYSIEDLQVLGRSFVNLLEGFSQDPTLRPVNGPLHKEDDIVNAVRIGQGQPSLSKWPSSMVERIDMMAQLYGDHAALHDGRTSLTYQEMISRVYSIANQLAELAPGAICVPMDLRVGIERLKLIVQDCNPSHIVFDSSTEGLVDVSRFGATSAIPLFANRANPTSPMMGIVIRHESVRNFVEFAPSSWGIEEAKETVLQQSAFSFDMALCKLVILDGTKRHDPDAICKSIVSQSYLLWIQHGRNQLKRSDWKRAISEFRALGKPDLRLINCYGPAETTFGCAANDVAYMNIMEAPYGLKPLPKYTIYILDDNQRPLPIGVPGRIAIGGAGVMKGYLHTDALTVVSLRWLNMYLSEDRGRFNAAGHLIIRGMRIELQDIENSIVRHIMGKDGPNTDFLVAFIVLSDTEPPSDPVSFIAGLLQQLPLPQYMRPSLTLPIPSLPYTVSGKLDRKAIDFLPLADSRTNAVPESGHNPYSSSSERMLRQLWKDVLPSDLASGLEIDSNTDFFQVGGSSIALVNLQRRIKQEVGIVVPIATLFQHMTLGKMAVLLKDGEERRRVPNPLTIDDLQMEAEIPVHIASIKVNDQVQAPRNEPETVALTGATGFLGREVLKQLLGNDKIRKIHCVAVRRELKQLPELFHNSKISAHSGNLRDPRLGLSESTANEICAEVDVFIHIAADVSFMNPYESLKPTNLTSIWGVVAMCLPRCVPVHFVSSANVSRLSGKDPTGPDLAGTYSLSNFQLDGYTATKWVAEVFLERVSRQRGLPVMIHRPSSITGHNSPAMDLMGNLMKYAKKTSAVPLLDGWSAYLDSISVERTAREIIEHVLLSQGTWYIGDKLRCVHEVGETETNVHDLKVVLGEIWGQELKVKETEEWINEAMEAGMDGLLGTYLRDRQRSPQAKQYLT
ncbi:hypothetical protein F5X98DRAFT_386188 [Xylaria grammica]|nr:hypothetical protein F5X98DRAFT_386188 [Xylaria grammica]